MVNITSASCNIQSTEIHTHIHAISLCKSDAVLNAGC